MIETTKRNQINESPRHQLLCNTVYIDSQFKSCFIFLLLDYSNQSRELLNFFEWFYDRIALKLSKKDSCKDNPDFKIYFPMESLLSFIAKFLVT